MVGKVVQELHGMWELVSVCRRYILLGHCEVMDDFEAVVDE